MKRRLIVLILLIIVTLKINFASQHLEGIDFTKLGIICRKEICLEKK